MVSNNNFESLHMTQSLPLQTYSANNIVSLNDNFIEGETFEVILKRNSLGLGLSITGKLLKSYLSWFGLDVFYISIVACFYKNIFNLTF